MASDIEGVDSLRGPVTVDKIGREYSYQEGEKQAELNDRYIKDTSFVTTQSAVSVADASYIPHIAALMETSKRAQWAFVESPPQKGSLSLFKASCIPSLGNTEQREVKMEAIRTQLTQLETTMQKQGRSLSFSDKKTLEQQIKHAHAILLFDQQVGLLDGIKDVISARFNQYHKG